MAKDARPALTIGRFEPWIEHGEAWLWRDVGDRPWHVRAGMRALRTGFAAGRDLAEGQVTLRAMSLVYTTLLALVPLLAISFSVLKAFEVHNRLEPFLLSVLDPLGERSAEIASQIVAFVDNIQVGVLGAVGMLLLFYAAVSLMRQIEMAFNETWQVTRQRSIAERVRDYFSVLLLGPVLVFLSLGVTAGLMSSTVAEWVVGIEPVGRVVELLRRLVPTAMVVFAFTFINMFVPNTRVRFGSALAGGLVAGLLWQGMVMLFAMFVGGATRYTAIYSGFATPILFMIWLYLGWLILLIGGTIAFYHQHPDLLPGRRLGMHLSFLEREQLALHLLRMIGEGFYGGEPPLGTETLAQRLRVPTNVVDGLVASLTRAGLVVRTGDDDAGLLPACPWERASVHEALEAVRRGVERNPRSRVAPARSTQVEDVLTQLEQLSRDAFDGLSLKAFVTGTGKVDVGDMPELELPLAKERGGVRRV